jgi:hypothetical protein
MEKGDTTGQDPSEADADDAIMAIWGVRRADETAATADAWSVDIWGSSRAETGAADSSEPDPTDPPPDLWGDGQPPRESRERTKSSDRPARFQLPPTWVATPKRKPGWLLRRPRP